MVEAVRERVRAQAAAQWRAPVGVVYIAKVRPEYRVKGRRSDGTVAGRRLVRRFFWNLVRFAGVLVQLVLDGDGDIDLRRGTVTAPPGSPAIEFADLARRARRVWVAWGAGQVLLAQADGRVLWSGPAQFGARQFAVVWADGGRVVLPPNRAEKARVRQEFR
ncbi:hypothetical protein N8J89_10985 [Crossiella sp. CA-258035]|uniref:hypothetical protein n=1 Tax=Crossiella sp. CA-258035 TaxID=2981138 RepID=UPI0024BBFA5B|nr:hypothetical protein [Crossiella sp. CA-258035]WHT21554.1 hypothetical protein N8J89_10985 [Crossiella sp. CA-258035]